MQVRFQALAVGIALLSSTVSGLAADLSPSPPPVLAASPSFFLFQDTTISYRFEPNAKEPGVIVPGGAFPKGPAQQIQKNIASLTHVDAYQYGTNFFTVDFLSSNSADPNALSGIADVPFTASGAFEVYGLYRGTLSGNALTHSHAFTFGFIKDVSLGFGGDMGTKDTYFGERKRLLVAGPQISFDVPGYLTVQANIDKEWGINNDSNPGTTKNASFRATPEFEVTYLQPLTFTGLPLSFSGFLNVVLPQGTGGIAAFPSPDTRTEVLTSNRISLDISSYLGKKDHVADIFVGYKYWYNKFGTNHKVISGAIENTVFFGAALHVF